jgi:hypothetical protein
VLPEFTPGEPISVVLIRYPTESSGAGLSLDAEVGILKNRVLTITDFTLTEKIAPYKFKLAIVGITT